jgi:hypothetical protein
MKETVKSADRTKHSQEFLTVGVPKRLDRRKKLCLGIKMNGRMVKSGLLRGWEQIPNIGDAVPRGVRLRDQKV